jgi:hypothetical protein
MESSFFIAITTHNPLNRLDPLLDALQAYETLPGDKDFYFFIDWEHRADVDDFREVINSNFPELAANYIVASEEYIGFSLTWAHKPLLAEVIKEKIYTFYIYAENDMIFSRENFDYWFKYKDSLKQLNLEPGFCRYEIFNDEKIPFDNYKEWQLNKLTPDVWGTRPFVVSSYITPGNEDGFVAFVSLGNPYAGLMILDQEDAEIYIESASADPTLSYSKTAHRNWPIADRSSMGLAFEGLNPDQEHRRVVPVIFKKGVVTLADCGLVLHRDTKYSQALSENNDSMLTVNSMFRL